MLDTNHTQKSLLFGVVSTILTSLVFFLLIHLGSGSETNFLNLITPFLILFTLLSSITGFFYAIVGLKEKRVVTSFLAFLLNGLFLVLVIVLLLMSANDLATWLFL